MTFRVKEIKKAGFMSSWKRKTEKKFLYFYLMLFHLKPSTTEPIMRTETIACYTGRAYSFFKRSGFISIKTSNNRSSIFNTES